MHDATWTTVYLVQRTTSNHTNHALCLETAHPLSATINSLGVANVSDVEESS